MNRRNLVLAGAAVIGGMGMGGTSTCSTSTGIDPAVLDKINQIIAGSCNAIGMAATIAAMVGAMFPGIGAAALTVGQIAEVAKAFCDAVNKPPQAGKFSAKLSNGPEIEVHGWVVKDNKVMQF